MDTHGNRALFSRAMVKVAACTMLAAGLPLAMYAEAGNTEAAVIAAQQTRTVSGQVVDSNGESIIGANIVEKGTANGTITDMDGKFSLKTAPNATLVISYIGYKTIEMKASEVKAGQTITLQENAEMMDEVVVIGYGTQRKGDVTSAVASVKAEDFTVGKITDAAELVKGKIAGLSVTNSSGDPTATSSIMLRGINTVSGNTNPLILVDGIEGDLTTVAPENIASIDVLKDASAAAIYGTRGANGVILITTKTGRRDQKADITYSGYVSFSKWTDTPEFMDTHDIIYGRTAYTYEGYDTDWLKAISRKAGFKHNHSLSMNGGTKTSTYSANVVYSNDEAIMRKSDNENLKMQLDFTQYAWNDKLKFNFNALISRQKYSLNNNTYAYRQAIIRNPSEPIYNEDGTYYENFNRLNYINPVEIQNEYEGDTRVRFYQMTGNVTVEPIKGWQTNVMLSLNESASVSQSFTYPDYYTLAKEDNYNGSASKSEGNYRSQTLEITSRYNHTWGEHRFEGLVGYSYLYNKYDGFSASNGNFPSVAYLYNNLGLGTLLTEEDRHAGMGSDAYDDTLVGFFARVSYGYANRYNALLSIRHEGSSKFGANNRWATFPSVSLGWTISNEPFMEKTRSWLNNLKLRIGYGVTGITPTSSYRAQYLYDIAPYGDIQDQSGNWIQTLEVIQNPNKDLKWETTREWNFGLDWSVLDERLSGSIDVYHRKTSDLMYSYSVPVPPNLYGYTLANVGDIRNVGVEVMVTGVPVRTKDFEWSTTLTLSHNKNKLLKLSNTLYETDDFHELYGGLGEPISTPTHYMEVGHSLGEFWGLKYVGVSENGVPIVQVSDGNGGWVNEEFNTNHNVMENRQRLGNGLPKVYLGWGHTFNYKGIDLNLQFTGQFGYKILNAWRCFYENNSIAYNRLKTAYDLRPAINLDGTPVLDADGNQKMVRLSNTAAQYFSSDHLENGDFLKLSNITLGYTLPLKGKIKDYINNLRIYASASNVFCITGYSGLDPEVDNAFQTPGIDYQDKYPTTRSYTVGLTLNF
ncbi:MULTISPECIES: SusC/RagA family TonB-linked outer membrane protein [Bacteroides]|uniref:SusC/RagA family TonB-linked outer membrane protein n=1 Tax=Bacteroides TaxID=816 RepID=UPI000B397D6A|nr:MULTISPECIES: TonB-dependent receptor [Bacteroides]MBM6946270.1 TonB-dependent receptor [Bacteroides gallinaceum]OUO50841.1 SusC/RagA family TonB-linked outer membrane protein [Bacteroides sp. An279]